MKHLSIKTQCVLCGCERELDFSASRTSLGKPCGNGWCGLLEELGAKRVDVDAPSVIKAIDKVCPFHVNPMLAGATLPHKKQKAHLSPQGRQIVESLIKR